MRNINLLFIVLSLSIGISCSQEKPEYNKIEINSEKSKSWNLPELNFTSKISKDYNVSYNESGGFYLQAKKFDKKGNLLAEISVGRIEGQLEEKNIINTLEQSKNQLENQLKNIEQIKYETTFIGENIINGKKVKNLRGIIEFVNYQETMNGKFYTFMTPIILDEKNKFIISSMFRETESLNKNKIGNEVLNFMKEINLMNNTLGNNGYK